MKHDRIATTEYVVRMHVSAHGASPLRIALVADLHNEPCDAALNILQQEKPDMIAVSGDLMTRKDVLDLQCNGLCFLRKAAAIAPTYYSLGNHELPANQRCTAQSPDFSAFCAIVGNTGAVLLDNSCVGFHGILIGGLTSVGSTETRSNRLDPAWLSSFASMHGPKVLLCHNPEYYIEYIKPIRDTGNHSILLVLSGHAHGGQWRIGRRGFFAPGQGFFPKYISGVYDNCLVVSRGLSNTLGPPLFPTPLPVPRFRNPKEIVIVDMV